MKTRTRNTLADTLSGTQVRIRRHLVTGAVIETNNVSLPSSPYTALVESITSEDPKRKHAGFCKHQRTETRYYINDLDIVDRAADAQYEYTFRGSYLAKEVLWPRSSYLTGNVLIDQVDWSALSFDAMRRLRPTLNPEGTMLSASLGEMWTPNMTAKWRRFRDEIAQSGWKRYIMWRYNQIRNNISRLPYRAANLHLWYQFGLKPFADDCFAIYRTLKSLEKRVNDLIAQAGKVRIKHWSRTLDTIRFPHVGEKDVWFAGARGAHLFQRFEFVTRPEYTATLSYILDASELKGLLGTIRGYTSALGLDRLLATIWELVPFSFLVDWFVDVGSFLDSLDDTLFGALPILILEYCDSIKYEYRTTCTYKFMVPPYTQVGMGCTLGQHTVKYYERRRSTPALLDLQSANGLTVPRTQLASSLAISAHGRRRPSAAVG